MIVKTRYRDIDWKDMDRRHHENLPADSLDWDKELRGRPLEIKVPAIPGDTEGCGGPWFWIVKGPAKAVFVCPHLAEIGD